VPLIAVNDIELYYESHGSGAPLVVLGGLGLAVSEMGALTGPLAARFRVIAVDNRGTGRSSKPAGPYSIEQMAADTAGLMDRLDLERAHLLGISMGGRIVLALALARPQRVDRLVLISTGPRAAGARWLVRAGMLAADLPVLRGRQRQPRYAMKAQFDATTRFDCTSRLGQIRAPALIVHGRSDHIAPLAVAEQMHRRIRGSRLVLIRGGHLAPLLTQHRRVVAEVTAFLPAGGCSTHPGRGDPGQPGPP
jgi:pimeloyl-ACP methyl ester carboxylesterase